MSRPAIPKTIRREISSFSPGSCISFTIVFTEASMWHGSVLLYRYESRILEFLEEGRSLNFSKLGAKNLVVKRAGGAGGVGGVE